MISTAESARSHDLQVEFGGQAIENAQRTSPGFATLVGAFGKLIAPALPARAASNANGAD